MKLVYYSFAFLLALAFTGCEAEEIAQPVDAPQTIDARELIMESASFHHLIDSKPAKGWSDAEFDEVLADFTRSLTDELAVTLSELPANTTIEEATETSKPLLFDVVAKAGPCSEAYDIDVQHAGAELGICAAGVDDLRDGVACVASFANEVIKAERIYEHCLRTTYPNAGG